ncbi:polyketide cyclase /reductase, partial [Streptomyces sp. MBT57]|nr:polyketide cyclase /reductase [Streptomyces sp. MBT57]
MSRARTAALSTVPLALAGVLATTAAAPAGAAAPRPGPSLTCQGKGVDSRAVVRARAETVIDAPLSTVWKLQTDVERWPVWQAHVTSADRLD